MTTRITEIRFERDKPIPYNEAQIFSLAYDVDIAFSPDQLQYVNLKSRPFRYIAIMRQNTDPELVSKALLNFDQVIAVLSKERV